MTSKKIKINFISLQFYENSLTMSKIGNICAITYDMFSEIISINGQTIDTIIIRNKKESIILF